MASNKARRDFRVADSSRRLAEHTVGGAHLRLPKGIPLFDPKKGVAYEIDIVPYRLSKKALEFKKNYAEPGELYSERTYNMHYGIGPDRDKVICLARTFGRPCPPCEYRNQLAEDPKHDKAAVKALFSKERQLWLLFCHQEREKGLQLWDISNWCFGKNLDDKMNNASPKKKPGYLQHYHPTEGFTLRITNVEKSADDRGGKFLEFYVDEFQERDEELTEEILKLVEQAPCLDEVPNALSYKELKRMFLQIDKAGDDEDGESRDREVEDPDEPPTRNGKARAQREEEPEEETVDDNPPDEPANEPKEAVEWEKGMEVTFRYNKKETTGTIVKIDTEHELLRVEVEGMEKLAIVDFDDPSLAKVEADEPKAAAKGGKPTGRPSRR